MYQENEIPGTAKINDFLVELLTRYSKNGSPRSIVTSKQAHAEGFIVEGKRILLAACTGWTDPPYDGSIVAFVVIRSERESF